MDVNDLFALSNEYQTEAGCAPPSPQQVCRSTLRLKGVLTHPDGRRRHPGAAFASRACWCWYWCSGDRVDVGCATRSRGRWVTAECAGIRSPCEPEHPRWRHAHAPLPFPRAGLLQCNVTTLLLLCLPFPVITKHGTKSAMSGRVAALRRHLGSGNADNSAFQGGFPPLAGPRLASEFKRLTVVLCCREGRTRHWCQSRDWPRCGGCARCQGGAGRSPL